MADLPDIGSRIEVPLRFRWMRAVQDSDLKPTPSLVAYAFGQFIGADRKNPPDTVWLSLAELQRVTRLSRDAANRGTRTLREAGWLVPVTAAAQHRSVLYRAEIPGHERYGSRTAEQYASRTADRSSSTPADTSSTSPDTSSTGGVPIRKEPGTKRNWGRPRSANDIPAVLAVCRAAPVGKPGEGVALGRRTGAGLTQVRLLVRTRTVDPTWVTRRIARTESRAEMCIDHGCRGTRRPAPPAVEHSRGLPEHASGCCRS